MFENKKILGILHLGAQVLDRPQMSSFNGMGRKAYLVLLPILLQSTLPKRVKLSLRHSAQNGHRFNLFLSDIDLSAFLEKPLEREISLVRKSISYWRKIIPSIGEIEIYTFDEKRELDEIYLKHQEIISFFHNLRKIEWMEAALHVSKSEYHAYKASRSISICLSKISQDLAPIRSGSLLQTSPFVERFITENFSSELGDLTRNSTLPEAVVDSKFFASPIFCGGPSGDKGLKLSRETGHLLLSVIPGSSFFPREVFERVIYLRTGYPRLVELHRDLSRYEMLMFRAFVRSQARELKWMSDWIEGVTREALHLS